MFRQEQVPKSDHMHKNSSPGYKGNLMW